jgi:hypothetical protein
MRMCCVAGASAALVLACSAHGAFVYTSTPGFGDADFLALTQGGSLERAVAESRIGNGATNGTWETAIWELGGQGAPKDQGQLNQQNGLTVPFSLSWDGVSTVTFSVGPETVSWNQVGGPFTDLFFRLRAGTGTQVEILNLSINGDAYAGSLFANQNQTLEYLRVQDMGGAEHPRLPNDRQPAPRLAHRQPAQQLGARLPDQDDQRHPHPRHDGDRLARARRRRPAPTRLSTARAGHRERSPVRSGGGAAAPVADAAERSPRLSRPRDDP